MSKNYASVLRASAQVHWQIDAILSPEATFDFERPFLPEVLAGTEALTFATPPERLVLNHIRAHGYLATFGIVEEFILPFVLDRLQFRLGGDSTEVRALLGFADEEAKHIELFRRFRDLFERSFGHRCDVIGPPSAIAEHVRSHGDLGVGLLILHIEWMTQRHYVEMVRDERELEPNFKRLLHHHWLEECQHARIDGWIVDALAETATESERREAWDDYVRLLAFFDQGLCAQVEFDCDAWTRATGRRLTAAQKAVFVTSQHRALRRTYLGAGISHPRVQASLTRIVPDASDHLHRLAEHYG